MATSRDTRRAAGKKGSGKASPPTKRGKAGVLDRDSDGRYAAGNPGGPGGPRPGAGRPPSEVKELERQLWNEVRTLKDGTTTTAARMAVERLIKMLDSESDKVKVVAANTILNRIFGRSRVTVELDNSASRTLGQIDEVTAAQVAILAIKGDAAP